MQLIALPNGRLSLSLTLGMVIIEETREREGAVPGEGEAITIALNASHCLPPRSRVELFAAVGLHEGAAVAVQPGQIPPAMRPHQTTQWILSLCLARSLARPSITSAEPRSIEEKTNKDNLNE